MFERLSFRSRRIVHYSLILCILLIQFLIAGFFYNEFITKKNLKFIETQLKEIHSLENLTGNSKKELLNAQVDFQKYLVHGEKKYLESYFESLHKLDKNLDSIDKYRNKYPRLNSALILESKDPAKIQKLKVLIDSTYEYSTNNNFNVQKNFPEIKKYDLNYYNFDKFNIETKTYSDTIKKKKFFGRIRDAISGRESIRKDSTVVTMKQGRNPNSDLIKADFDSILNIVNKHYTVQLKQMQTNVIQKDNSNTAFYKIFSNLLMYGNSVMNIYDYAIKNSRVDLEKEYYKQNSNNNRMRMNLIFGAMILMLIISVLIMMLTSIAFSYEKRLKAANLQINANLEFKNRVLGMLSHELRSPLKIIGILINRIDEKTDDEEIKEYLKSIGFTSNTLLLQSNQILEYTKNQHVKNKLIPVVFNLNDQITSILNSIENYIKTRNNKFVINKNINADLVVYSDNTKISQLFMNILGNANKFTENGQITVNIKTEKKDDAAIVLNTEIIDTGVGIAESDLKKIFEPYYQGVLSDDIENIGAGLGLSLCKELVELYGGKISVQSEPRKGTTVTFSLNLQIQYD
ncbi:signal transduction histidine kinase [Chryseobacterium sp. SLBN-27]|uniref:sensor histidine kinase n=1 Tax=Chryseobacterium sp. SLBN-27 TaxID=3042287 RepID=UPI00286323FE|nr:HAMP domain-containing sensor histidine kinase [Chryseobacterium sp. SLBN-27]MDR6160319.1 signal transduction histidine kinase [Chryseobacterium sp. SLBN-27]